MDDDLALRENRPQSISDPQRRTWPRDWALPLLGNTSLRQPRTPGPSPSSPGICEAEPGTSFCHHSSTSRPPLLASSATMQPEPSVYRSSPNIRLQSLNFVNSTCGRRTYDPVWRPSRSRSWSPCSRLGRSDRACTRGLPARSPTQAGAAVAVSRSPHGREHDRRLIAISGEVLQAGAHAKQHQPASNPSRSFSSHHRSRSRGRGNQRRGRP